MNRPPSGTSGDNQNACRNRENGTASNPVVGLSELVEITITRAAGGKVIEPVFGLRQWHLVSGNSSENLRAWTPGSVRIWKLVEQASAQCIQDAPFVSL
jgi:hypothetical protein